MENNYNIKMNPEEPGAEQIAAHQDFDALLNAHGGGEGNMPDATPAMGKLIKLGLGALMAGAAAIMLLYFAPRLLSSGGEDLADRPYVNPPLKNVQAKFASYKVDAHEGGVYEYGNGSRVIVPARAFTYEDGSEVEGEVELKYREFHDYVDFFLSGIPMEYDSAGVQHQLESAGMMEIYAEQGGKALRVNPDKKIDIELASSIALDGNESAYNIYKLDTDKRNWDYRGKDAIEVIEDASETVNTKPLSRPERQLNRIEKKIDRIAKKETEEIETLERSVPKPAAPKPPKRANPDGYVFDFEVEEDRFPELAAYDDVLWQVNDGQAFNEVWYQIEWEDVKVDKTAADDVYKVTLSAGNRVVHLNVSPVLSGSDYQAAQQAFQARVADYEQGLAQREASLRDQRTAILARNAEEREKLEAEKVATQARVAELKKQGRKAEATNVMVASNIVNRFQVTEMGIWNCDRPLPPYQQILVGNFCDENFNTYKGNPVYIVNKSNNTVARFYAKKRTQVRINTRDEKLMWMVTDDGQLAIFSAEQFNNLIPKKEHTFTMMKIPEKVENEADVRRILSL